MVEVLTDARRFGEVMRAFKPTHVVSDLHMPHVSGIEVLREAREIDARAIRVLLSGSLQSVSKASLAEVEPVRLIAKPWNANTLKRDLGIETAGRGAP